MLTIDTSNQAALQTFLARRHPEYVELAAHWEFLAATYKGGREWFNGNIFQYVKEGDDEYQKRIQRAYRFNHTREVVDLIQKYIFKSEIARNVGDAPDVVKTFWQDSTLSGLDIGQYMRLVSNLASIYGRIWIFVDSNKSGEIITIEDEKNSGARTYSYIVTPLDILDIGFDDVGGLNWILVREYVRDDKDPINSSGETEERYRLWTKNEWFLFEINDDETNKTNAASSSSIQQLNVPGVVSQIVLQTSNSKKVTVELVEQGINPLGVVPCFPVDNVIGENRYSAPSLIADIAYLDRSTANYLSNLDAIIQDQTFSQLAMPAQGILPGESAYEALLEMGTKRIFLYDGEAGVSPAFISPDVKQAEIIVQVVNKIINEIYHSLGMGGERTKQDNAVGIDNSSGVAKAYDFERLNSLLTTKSASLQNAENKLAELVCMWNRVPEPSEETEKLLIKYPDTFDVRSLYDEFTVAERLALIDAPKLVRQEQMKQVITKLFPAIKSADRQTMIDSLKDWPITQADLLAITGVETGGPSSKFPATGKLAPAPGAPANPATKNSGSANRQGQVTSKTK